MKFNSLLRLGLITGLSVMTLMPLMAFDFHTNKPSTTLATSIETAAVVAASPVTEAPAAIDLGPAVLAATYKGHSGCLPTNQDFEVRVEVLDAANDMYRVVNLLDEGQTLKAKLKDGKLDMGKQRMGSYMVTGNIQYLENPARIETRVKYDDGVGYCDDVSVFVKR
jgi:hypothetical protein